VNRRRLWLAAAIASGVLLWICSALVFVNLVRPRLAPPVPSLQPADLVYCEAQPEALCVVSFGADRSDRMQIDLGLPFQTFPRFYLILLHAAGSHAYACEVVPDVARRVRCLGPRTPLGEAVVIEVRSTTSDALLARGVFVVASIALPTPVSVSITPITPSPSPAATATPRRTRTPTPAPTSTPVTEPPATNETAIETESPVPSPTETPTPSETLES
jgi:hypothetical protein